MIERRLCPACCQKYAPGAFRVVDTFDKPVVEAWWRRAWRTVQRMTGRTEPELKRHLERLKGGEHFVCPAGHAVPASFMAYDTYPIALIGPSASSKTTYLAVLLDRLTSRAPLRDGFGWTFALDAHSRERFDELYREPLLREPPEPPAKTDMVPGVHEPLIVRMSREDDSGNRTTVNLFFFDAAGESYRRVSDAAGANPYLGCMAGALVFATPVMLHDFPERFWLPDNMEPGTAPTPAFLTDALNNTVSIRNGAPGVPTALLMAKYDELLVLEQIDDDIRRLRAAAGVPARSPGPLRAAESHRSSAVAHEVFRKYGAGILAAAEDLGLPLQVFATSAMGRGPRPDGRFSSVDPFGIYEPLSWLLSTIFRS